jgi:hypothetical protein
MITSVLPTAPDRDALRALYDEAIKQINPSRPTVDLTTGFYADTGSAVFDAGYLALNDYCKGPSGPRRLHVVSAPAGGGKTSYSYALMLALTKYAEQTPDAPYGCVFVVDQIRKADEAFKDLNALAHGKVAVWTRPARRQHARCASLASKTIRARWPHWVPAFRLRALRFGGLQPAEARQASVGGSRGQANRRKKAEPKTAAKPLFANVLWSQMFGATVIKMSFVSRHIPYRYTAPEPVLDLLRRDLARRTFRICYLCESCPA